MSIGYASKVIGVANSDFKSCLMKNATEERLMELIAHNLQSLNQMIDYNIKNNIQLFRISSDLIPFGSSEVNKLNWWKLFAGELSAIGEKVKQHAIRVSLHPGQYTVLNSNKEDVVEAAVADLVYHTRILDALGVDASNKMVLHIGGAYGDKEKAMQRFIDNYLLLDERIKRRLVIENDHKIYHIEEVLRIGILLGIPVIFDNLHHEINPPPHEKEELYWIDACKATWGEKDGRQKTHYSQQAIGKNFGAHSDFIRIAEFMSYYEKLAGREVDIMLEVKDKNLSCIKCMYCTTPHLQVKKLEKEWSKYKYTVLERSHADYLKIRNLLKLKEEEIAIDFYNILEDGLTNEGNVGSFKNGAMHVWGYFKNDVSEKEKERFLHLLQEYQEGQMNITRVKKYLKALAQKYERTYLLESYYFVL